MSGFLKFRNMKHYTLFFLLSLPLAFINGQVFTEITGTPFEDVASSSIAFADIDGDNDMDVLIAGAPSFATFPSPISKLYTNDGDGVFSEVENTPFEGVFAPSVAFSDIDGDGDLDAVFTGESKVGDVFEIYMKRSKIEGVFKFCKEELGWENFRNRKFEGIKNLIGLIYFITGYFYEIESEVIKHPAAQWLANLGKGKGKVTPYYIIRGIGKLYHFLELQELLAQSKNEQNMAKMAVETFFANKSNFE